MRISKAKQSIIETAQELIEQGGYSNLNINEVAYTAKVSVGTLYYHFPKGKIDILTEILSRKTEEYAKEFNQTIGIETFQENDLNMDDALRWIFNKVIELRRNDRQFLTAIQGEMFSNPDEYTELVKRYRGTDGITQTMDILSEVMTKKMDTSPSDLNRMEDKLERVQKIIGLLMTYQIIFPGYFGDDEEFIDQALKIFYEIMRP